MNKEKVYLIKTADLVSDKKAENANGVMYANVVASKNVYITYGEVKNEEREIYFVKNAVCNYCKDIYQYFAKTADTKNIEFYTNSAEFYSYALQNNVDAEKIWTTTKQITDVKKDLNKTKQEDDDMKL